MLRKLDQIISSNTNSDLIRERLWGFETIVCKIDIYVIVCTTFCLP